MPPSGYTTGICITVSRKDAFPCVTMKPGMLHRHRTQKIREQTAFYDDRLQAGDGPGCDTCGAQLSQP